MTTQYKITRADITADASQNRDGYHREQFPAMAKALRAHADAPAKPAHTPETVSQRIIQNFFAGIPGGELQAMADAAPETAAERDRLKVAAREFAELAIKAERERDQAREQVKTLLAACKKGMELQGPGDIWSVDPGKMDAFKRAAQAAITSAESEQAK